MSIRVCVPLLLLLLLHFSADCQPQPPNPSAPYSRALELQRGLVSDNALSRGAASRLKQILAAPEFSEKMRRASIWDAWKAEFETWLMKHFAALFNSIAQHPSTSKTIFWAAALGALAFIGFQLFRIFRTDEMPQSASPLARSAEARSPTDWIAAARSAAELQDFNRAIQCSYWAAITSLQASGTLPRNPSFTPREFLRALRISQVAEHLRTLTSYLERFWYGRRPATAEDFSACLKSLEGLGCNTR